jgi:hypothetical protein
VRQHGQPGLDSAASFQAGRLFCRQHPAGVELFTFVTFVARDHFYIGTYVTLQSLHPDSVHRSLYNIVEGVNFFLVTFVARDHINLTLQSLHPEVVDLCTTLLKV